MTARRLVLAVLLLGVASPAWALQTSTWWAQVELAQIDLVGTFTTLRLEESATEPLGQFSELTVASSEGLFADHVALGETIPGGDLLAPMDWHLGDLDFHTAFFFAAGPEWGPSVVAPAREGLVMTGLTLRERDYAFWEADLPGVGRTGAFTLSIQIWTTRVPEPATWMLLLPALAGLAVTRTQKGSRRG